MGVVVAVIVGIAVAVGAVVFYRAVFGGSTFGGRRVRADDQGGPPGPRPDGHLGANRTTGGGGVGGTDFWAGGDGS